MPDWLEEHAQLHIIGHCSGCGTNIYSVAPAEPGEVLTCGFCRQNAEGSNKHASTQG